MKLVVGEGFEALSTPHFYPNPPPLTGNFNEEHPAESAQNYFKSLHDKLELTAITNFADTLTSFGQNTSVSMYTTSRFGDHASAGTSRSIGTVLVGSNGQPRLRWLGNNIEISQAYNQFRGSGDGPWNLIVKLTNGDHRTFVHTHDLGIGWKGFDTYGNGGSPLTLTGTNGDTSGMGWHKLHFQIYKSGTDLKVSMASSRDVADVVTYTESIGAEDIESVYFASAQSGGGNTENYVDDLNVWEIESGDIAGLDAGFGTWTYQPHIRHLALWQDGTDVQKTTNGDADDWGFSDTGSYEDTSDLNFTSYATASTNQLGKEQIRTFLDIAADSGVVATDIKCVGISVLKVADNDGEQLTLKIKNGASEVDESMNTQAGEWGAASAFYGEGSTEFDTTLNPAIGTNGMIFTVRKT